MQPWRRSCASWWRAGGDGARRRRSGARAGGDPVGGHWRLRRVRAGPIFGAAAVRAGADRRRRTVRGPGAGRAGAHRAGVVEGSAQRRPGGLRPPDHPHPVCQLVAAGTAGTACRGGAGGRLRHPAGERTGRDAVAAAGDAATEAASGDRVAVLRGPHRGRGGAGAGLLGGHREEQRFPGAGPAAAGVDGGRRVLRDPQRPPIPPPDIVERVHTGMAQRRTRRRAATVVAAVLAVAAVAVVSAVLTRGARPLRRRRALAGRAGRAVQSPAADRVPPAQRRGLPGRGPAAGRRRRRVRDRPHRHLRPHAEHRPQSLHVVRLPPADRTYRRRRPGTHPSRARDLLRLPPETQQRPATIDPAEQAGLTIETSYTCEGGAPASTTTYRRVRIRLADGATFDIADRLGSSCPFRIGTWYRPVQRTATVITSGGNRKPAKADRSWTRLGRC